MFVISLGYAKMIHATFTQQNEHKNKFVKKKIRLKMNIVIIDYSRAVIPLLIVLWMSEEDDLLSPAIVSPGRIHRSRIRQLYSP